MKPISIFLITSLFFVLSCKRLTAPNAGSAAKVAASQAHQSLDLGSYSRDLIHWSNGFTLAAPDNIRWASIRNRDSYLAWKDLATRFALAARLVTDAILSATASDSQAPREHKDYLRTLSQLSARVYASWNIHGGSVTSDQVREAKGLMEQLLAETQEQYTDVHNWFAGYSVRGGRSASTISPAELGSYSETLIHWSNGLTLVAPDNVRWESIGDRNSYLAWGDLSKRFALSTHLITDTMGRTIASDSRAPQEHKDYLGTLSQLSAKVYASWNLNGGSVTSDQIKEAKGLMEELFAETQDQYTEVHNWFVGHSVRGGGSAGAISTDELGSYSRDLIHWSNGFTLAAPDNIRWASIRNRDSYLAWKDLATRFALAARLVTDAILSATASDSQAPREHKDYLRTLSQLSARVYASWNIHGGSVTSDQVREAKGLMEQLLAETQEQYTDVHNWFAGYSVRGGRSASTISPAELGSYSETLIHWSNGLTLVAPDNVRWESIGDRNSYLAWGDLSKRFALSTHLITDTMGRTIASDSRAPQEHKDYLGTLSQLSAKVYASWNLNGGSVTSDQIKEAKGLMEELFAETQDQYTEVHNWFARR